MNRHYTHISIILDRTGSMQSIRDDTIGGFNAFLEEQKKQSGQATLTLVQFDSDDPFEVIQHFQPIANIHELTRETYVPRGWTPLFDAIGRGINDLDKSLAQLADEQRPANVMLVVVTDGEENSSQEFSKSDVERMVKEKKDAGWQFVFLAADLGAMRDARGSGIPTDSSLYYSRNARGSSSAWHSLSSHTGAFRRKPGSKIGFKPEERRQANADEA